MSIHKLTAGSGYDYLTRQVAAQDATERGHSGLASYYSAQGEAPGVWVGSGLDGIEGLSRGDVVTEEQMRNLFASGKHPLAEQLRAAAADESLDERGRERAAWLGTPYKVYANDVSPFRLRVAQRVGAANAERGLPPTAIDTLQERARIRTEVAVQLFREEFHRDPADAREIAATIAKHSRPRTNAVAGYDLTFSPVKSVATLWAVADKPVAAAIERAHQMAVRDALAYIEAKALFTREGTNGVRQVETRGLIATAFTHRDSRAGDPDLHTHVAVANKVQTRKDGRWLAIDGRLIFKANVAASETYNTRLEHHLRKALGVRFAEVPNADSRKRPVREIVGVDPTLNEHWSSRRASIQARLKVLAKDFQATHGRPPSPIESIQLAQQATLETRQAKHEPRSLDEQRATWARQAQEVLGAAGAVESMVAAALAPSRLRSARVDTAWIHCRHTPVQALPLAAVARRGRGPAPDPRRRPAHRRSGPGRGTARRRRSHPPLRCPDPRRRRRPGAAGSSTQRPFKRLHGVRLHGLHLTRTAGRRGPRRGAGGPGRRQARPSPRGRPRHGLLGRQRAAPQRRPGHPRA